MMKRHAVAAAALASTLLWMSPVKAQDEPEPEPITVSTINDLITELEKIVADDPSKGTETIAEGFDVLTVEGSHYPFLPSEQNAFLQRALESPARCGGSRPVIYVQPAGGYEYRWCVRTVSTSAYMDTYKYSGGSLSCIASTTVPCSSTAMPGPVRLKVQCP
jgi:hypothetical protein